MDWLSRDLRTGLRLLARDKAYSLTAAATLALCLGANTALFSVVHHVLLRPLPVPEPERILLMSNQYPRAGAADSSNSGVPDYYDRQRDDDRLRGAGALQLHEREPRPGRPARRACAVMNVTPSYLRVMRTAPALGRPFTRGGRRDRQREEAAAERRAVAQPVRGRPRRRRQRPAHRRPALHDRRRDAAGVRGARARRRACGGRSPSRRRRSPTSGATATTTGTSAGSSRARRSSRRRPRSTR